MLTLAFVLLCLAAFGSLVNAFKKEPVWIAMAMLNGVGALGVARALGWV